MVLIDAVTHRKVVVLHLDQTVLQAARAMFDNGIGSIVVGDHEGHIVGIITDRDLSCSVLAFSLSSDTPLSEVMTSNPITLEEGFNLQLAAQLMIENGIRRIPIVHRRSGDKRKCIGMITLDDLVSSQACDPQTLGDIVKSQVLRIRKHFDEKHTVKHSEIVESAFTRSEARAEHTLNRFYKKIGVDTGLNEALIEPVTKFILSSLVQRLHYISAAHFIAQLPKMLQEDLLDLPAGPKRSINLEK